MAARGGGAEDSFNVLDLVENAKKQPWWRKVFGPSSGSSAEKYNVATQLLIGGVTGWCTGFIFQKVGKLAATAVGGGFFLLQVCMNSEPGFLRPLLVGIKGSLVIIICWDMWVQFPALPGALCDRGCQGHRCNAKTMQMMFWYRNYSLLRRPSVGTTLYFLVCRVVCPWSDLAFLKV
ncbi:FUN14 domain-containing protein 2 isoform 1-T1 [Amazona ochrocephala]